MRATERDNERCLEAKKMKENENLKTETSEALFLFLFFVFFVFFVFFFWVGRAGLNLGWVYCFWVKWG